MASLRAINTARQLGFVLGVAVLVAVFSHTMSTALQDAKAQAATLVDRAGVPAETRAQVLATVEKGAAGGGAGAIGTGGADVRAAAAGVSPEQAAALRPLVGKIQAVYKQQISDAFRVPFLVAAGAALLILIPASLAGRHLGAHTGAHERRRGVLPANRSA